MSAVPVIITYLLDVLGVVTLLWPILKKVFPKLAPKLSGGLGKVGAAVGVTSAVGAASSVTSKIYNWLLKFPSWFVGLFKSGGSLHFIFEFCRKLKNSLGWRVIFFVLFMLGTWFDTIFEFFFLIIGGVSMRILTMITKWAFSKQMSEDNTETLKTIMGDSIDNLPPCMIDVMGYLHLVENLGMIVSTLVFIGILNLITRLYYKWL